jgi:hypothetical protein
MNGLLKPLPPHRSALERILRADVLAKEAKILELGSSVLSSSASSAVQKEAVRTKIDTFRGAHGMLEFLEHVGVDSLFIGNIKTVTAKRIRLLQLVSTLGDSIFADMHSQFDLGKAKENRTKQTLTATRMRTDGKAKRRQIVKDVVLRRHRTGKARLTLALKQKLRAMIKQAGLQGVSDQTLRADAKAILNERAAKKIVSNEI